MELRNTLKKIRACEGDAAAQVLFEAFVALELAAANQRIAELEQENARLREEKRNTCTMCTHHLKRLEATEKERDELRFQWEKHKADFHPDWDQVEAAKDSIREHMEIINELRERLKAAEEVVEAVRIAMPILQGYCWIKSPQARLYTVKQLFYALAKYEGRK